MKTKIASPREEKPMGDASPIPAPTPTPEKNTSTQTDREKDI